MSTDSDTSSSPSSSSSEDHKRRKSRKKHKKRAEQPKEKKSKKAKKHKSKKHASKSREGTIGHPPRHASPAVLPEQDAAPVEDTFGPALPPHLREKQTQEAQIIGPVMPAAPPKAGSDSEEDFGYGPMPLGPNADAPMTATQIELEQRALELKLAAIEGANTGPIDQTVREEWMLELPEVGLKTGLAALANLKRTFHQGKERPDFSDRSSWTKTPHSGTTPEKPMSSKRAAETLEEKAQSRYQKERDEAQERIARKHSKKHKRDESLVEIHQKKLRKEQRAKEKALAAAGAKPERRPFSRDVDLKLNMIDKDQTKKIVDKAKILNTKFAAGHTKYL